MTNPGKSISAKQLRVYFLGSGLIAIPVLGKLLASDFIDLVGCGTQPDRPQGRKRRMTATPVGQFCEENNLAVDKPDSANSPDFLERLRSLQPDLVLVFAFGQILAKQLLNLPPLGCVNIHASLLPKYRGAAPVNAAILAGDKTTGITLMRMTRGLDSGPIFRCFELAMTGKETAPELSDRLANLAADSTEDVLREIADGLQPVPQNHDEASHAPKITKEDGQINWETSADHVERMVRAYTPWPGAYFFLRASRKTRRITITQASVIDDEANHAPGEIIQADKHAWIVACGTGAIKINKLIPEGKKEMTGTEFIRGCPLHVGISLHETDHYQSREPADSHCTRC